MHSFKRRFAFKRHSNRQIKFDILPNCLPRSVGLSRHTLRCVDVSRDSGVYLSSFITTGDDRLLVTQQDFHLPTVEIGDDFNMAASLVSDYSWLIKVGVGVTIARRGRLKVI